ncbi:MAG: tryptophan synthase subunit alpha, partial [Candidatus Methanomethylicia archaeon]
PIFANLENNIRMLSEVGCEGIIIPDINVEEMRIIKPIVRKNKLKMVGFVAPNTGNFRIRQIVRYTDGFIYLVSSYGTTGIRDRIE